jgi:hypothetical protein
MRLPHRLVALVALLLVGSAAAPPCALAQAVYGRVRGSVTDSLGPVIGATVSLVGTAFAATTGLRGGYALDGVPAGRYVVRVASARWSPLEREDVAVQGGETTVVDAAFGGAGIVWRSERGAAASATTLKGASLADLPIDDARQWQALASGVAMRGTDIGIAAAPHVTIRGSDADQTGVYVDGAPARFETLGLSQLSLGADAISAVTVMTGEASAAVGEMRDAAVSYTTRAGGPRLEAGLGAGTDGPFARSATVGFNRFDGFAGGPVPGVSRLTWFVSGALYGQSSAYRGAGADTVPVFALAGIDSVVSYATATGTGPTDTTVYTAAVPRFAQVSGSCGGLGGDSTAEARAIRDNYGLACRGLRRPLDWSTSRRAQVKLRYTYGAGSSLSLTGLASDFQQRQYPGQNIADNALFTGVRSASHLVVLNWRHHLARRLHGALVVTGNLAFGGDAYQSGPLELESEAATADPALGIEMSRLRFSGLDNLPLPLTDAVIQAIREGTFKPPYYGRYDLLPLQSFRFNPYGISSGWPTSGLSGDALVTSESRVTGRLGGEWRATPEVRVDAGLDFSRTEVSYYAAPIVTPTYSWNAFRAHPRRVGGYAEGLIEEGRLTVEAGVRGDRYESGADFPKVPGRIFSNPAVLTGDTSYAARMSRVLDAGRSQFHVSPRVRMRLEVDDRTDVRVGVGQQVEVPPYAALYANVNTDLYWANSDVPFGTDVKYVTSTLLEAGVRRALSHGFTVDASLYEKTNVVPYDFEGTPVYDPFIGGTPGVSNATRLLLRSTSGSYALGGDLRLELAAGGWIAGSAMYSIWRTHVEAPPLGPPPLPQVVVPDVTTQAVSGTVTLLVPDRWGGASTAARALRGAGISVVGRLTSGAAYTPLYDEPGAGTIVPPTGLLAAQLGGAVEARLPWIKALDVRLFKRVEAKGIRWTAYAEARNLLDIRQLVSVFAATGTPANGLFRQNMELPQVSQLQSDAGQLWQQRQVTVGGASQALWGVNLTDCSRYPSAPGGARGVPDCLALRQVEARWGNGDMFYDTNEITRALNAWYDQSYGSWRFYAPARTARVGVQVEF